MRRFCVFLLIIILTLVATPSQAASYKLTIYYDYNIFFALSAADERVAELDSGETTCFAVLAVAALRGYDPENLSPLMVGTNYKVKNESGKVIASGKFKPKTSRPGGMGSGICRTEVTLSLPKATFYDVEISKGIVLISGIPFKVFKKNVAKVDIFDWN